MLAWSITLNKSVAGADLVVVAVSCMLSFISLFYNVKALRTGLTEYKDQAARTAVLSGVYFIAYSVLIFTSVNRLSWSTAMIGVSWIVWAVVWTEPARWSIREQRKMIDLKHRVRKELSGE